MGRCEGQVAQAATEIEHLAEEMRQDGALEGIERVVRLAHLPGKLPIEKIHRGVSAHAGDAGRDSADHTLASGVRAPKSAAEASAQAMARLGVTRVN
ncbi:MAG: hypothetical protein ACREU1_04645 [Burkholderiales bacterium]